MSNNTNGMAVVTYVTDRWTDYIAGIVDALNRRSPADAIELAERFAEQVKSDTDKLAQLRRPLDGK